MVAAALAIAVTTVAQAQRGIPVARDAETEALLNSYVAPFAKVAGVRMPEILLVPSNDFNAFVTPSRKMFVNTGAIITASRSVIYAYEKNTDISWQSAIEDGAKDLKQQIADILGG